MGACIQPHQVWKNPFGGSPLFKPPKKTPNAKPNMLLPCGKCPTCSQRHRKDWTIRCIHEMKYHQTGCVITLTFNPEYLATRQPHPWSVDKTEVIEFIRKLRKYINRYENANTNFKYLACGEYGSKTHRPHYHIAIFGWKPNDIDYSSDRNLIASTPSRQYLSEFIDRVWSHGTARTNKGRATVGTLTPESVAYVAGYVTKKHDQQFNKKQRSHYNKEEGTYVWLQDEFLHGSQGIGKKWILQYYKEVYRNGFIVNTTGEKSIKFAIPRYYDKIIDKVEPKLIEKVKEQRLELLQESELNILFETNQTGFENELARQRINATLKFQKQNRDIQL